jgi:hypothetical protein
VDQWPRPEAVFCRVDPAHTQVHDTPTNLSYTETVLTD